MLVKRFITPIRTMIICAASAATLTSAPAFSVGSHDLGHAHKAGIGEPANDSQAGRTVEVFLKDMYFFPGEIHVKAGETIRFNLKNDGQVVHEFSIGTAHMHAQHQAEMLMMLQHGMMTSTSVDQKKIRNSAGRGDSMAHDDPNSKLLEPGASAEIVWTFAEETVLEFACNIPGHYDSGMVGAFIFHEESDQVSSAD